MLKRQWRTPGKAIRPISFLILIFLVNSTIMGVKCKDGIIIGTEKIVVNKMMLSGTDKRIHSITSNMGVVCNGLVPDGKNLVFRGRDEDNQYQKMYGIRMPTGMLANRLAS